MDPKLVFMICLRLQTHESRFPYTQGKAWLDTDLQPICYYYFAILIESDTIEMQIL
jgi:hypothetical protein